MSHPLHDAVVHDVVNTSLTAHTLTQRLRRARRLFRETRVRRCWIAATTLAARLLLLKVPLLLRHLKATKQTNAVRAAVEQGRNETPGELYLALAVSGGLGDMLVIAQFVQDLATNVGGFQFDIFSPTPKQTAWAFAKVSGFRLAYHDIAFGHTMGEYDLAMRVNQSVVVHQECVRWGSVRHNRHLMQIVDNLARFRPTIEVFIDRHPWLDRFLAQTAVFGDATRRDFLHRMAGLPYGTAQLSVPQDASIVTRLGLGSGRYVTVHNGFDPGFVISNRRATKCYPHFGAVVAHLKAALPHLAFVQVGATTSAPIAQCDLILLNKTSLDEVAGLLANAALHLDNESGLVHLAACLGTRSAVVFGPTPSDYFGYPGNINIDPPVCGNCWWMTRTWMDVCAKGYDTPRCMTEQDPDAVAARILREIEQFPCAWPLEASAAPAEVQ
jgi:hypothetical protein